MPLWKQDLLTLTVQTVVKGVHIAQCSILCLVEYFFIFILSIELLVLGFTACDYRFGIFTLFLTFDSRETILNICFSETTEAWTQTVPNDLLMNLCKIYVVDVYSKSKLDDNYMGLYQIEILFKFTFDPHNSPIHNKYDSH